MVEKYLKMLQRLILGDIVSYLCHQQWHWVVVVVVVVGGGGDVTPI